MQLRYIEGAEITDVCAALGFSQAGYFREHRVAIETVIEGLTAQEKASEESRERARLVESELPGKAPPWDKAFQAVGELVLEPPDGIASNLESLGRRMLALGDTAKAGEFLRKALERFREK